MNNDYKIITKVLSFRLKNVIHELISEDQRGCIKGRHSQDCIRILEDVIENGMEDDACILLLDQEKAFDRVDIDWMFKVLEEMGFGRYFLKWLKILYKNANSAIITNGFISNYFQIKRGVRQGDSLSALLYILQAEPLANAIRNSPEIKGIELNLSGNSHVEHKICQYVDDNNILLQDCSMIEPCLDIIADFNLASGSKTNLLKTKCLTKNGTGPRQISQTKGPEKALGILIGLHTDQNQQWMSKINKMKACMSIWKTRNLTYKGKVQLIKTYALSNILYSLEVLDPSDYMLKEFRSIIWDFLWDGKKHGKVKRDICFLPRNDGGLDMPDISKITTTRRVKFVSNVVSEPSEKWKYVARHYFSILDSHYGMPYFLLNVTESKIFLPKNIPTFYRNCILQYQSYIRKITKSQMAKDEILEQIIWHNHRITFNSKPLDWRHWGNSGLIRIKDIFTDRGTLDTLKIRNKLRNRSNMFFELNIIKRAIPPEWIAILQSEMNTEYTFQYKNEAPHSPLYQNVASKDIYSKLVGKEVPNRSKLYWEQKFHLIDYDWEACFSKRFYTKLIPRKIHDFNFKIFHGVLPVENRLKKMNISDGVCKICKEEIENSEHLFYSCKTLENIWVRIESVIKAVSGVEIILEFKHIILGIEDENVVNKDIIDMLIFMTKWDIWKRRNAYVFENDFKSLNTIWKSYCYHMKTHCKTLLNVKSVKKIKGLSEVLLKLTDILETI